MILVVSIASEAFRKQVTVVILPGYLPTCDRSVQKGDQPGEVAITGEDGRVWELHSTTSKLDEHINHKVTVTGTATRDTKVEAKKEGQVENASGKQEYGDLLVSSLTMVSKTCSK